tara:strand:+ start:19284 stop:19730 length:447 start_codon:yes stop_codon:yes gene_type:complete
MAVTASEVVALTANRRILKLWVQLVAGEEIDGTISIQTVFREGSVNAKLVSDLIQEFTRDPAAREEVIRMDLLQKINTQEYDEIGAVLQPPTEESTCEEVAQYVAHFKAKRHITSAASSTSFSSVESYLEFVADTSPAGVSKFFSKIA